MTEVRVVRQSRGQGVGDHESRRGELNEERDVGDSLADEMETCFVPLWLRGDCRRARLSAHSLRQSHVCRLGGGESRRRLR